MIDEKMSDWFCVPILGPKLARKNPGRLADIIYIYVEALTKSIDRSIDPAVSARG